MSALPPEAMYKPTECPHCEAVQAEADRFAERIAQLEREAQELREAFAGQTAAWKLVADDQREKFQQRIAALEADLARERENEELRARLERAEYELGLGNQVWREKQADLARERELSAALRAWMELAMDELNVENCDECRICRDCRARYAARLAEGAALAETAPPRTQETGRCQNHLAVGDTQLCQACLDHAAETGAYL